MSIGTVSYKSVKLTGWKGALAFWGGCAIPWIVGWCTIIGWVLR